jgi:signal transduction histidine kinase
LTIFSLTHLFQEKEKEKSDRVSLAISSSSAQTADEAEDAEGKLEIVRVCKFMIYNSFYYFFL